MDQPTLRRFTTARRLVAYARSIPDLSKRIRSLFCDRYHLDKDRENARRKGAFNEVDDADYYLSVLYAELVETERQLKMSY
jgi:hypothetical protein